MEARTVLLAAVCAGLAIGSFSGASQLPTMNAAPEQPWEKMLRPDPPADPYAVAYASPPQDFGAPNWMEPRVPISAWEIEQYSQAFAQSFYDDLPIGDYMPANLPPLPGLEEARSEIAALSEANREAHDAAAASAAIAARVEEMDRSEDAAPKSETAGLAADNARST